MRKRLKRLIWWRWLWSLRFRKTYEHYVATCEDEDRLAIRLKELGCAGWRLSTIETKEYRTDNGKGDLKKVAVLYMSRERHISDEEVEKYFKL